jgi:hypothetical protein
MGYAISGGPHAGGQWPGKSDAQQTVFYGYSACCRLLAGNMDGCEVSSCDSEGEGEPARLHTSVHEMVSIVKEPEIYRSLVG